MQFSTANLEMGRGGSEGSELVRFIIIIIIIIIYLPMSKIHEKRHNEYTVGKTYKAHRALTVALN